MAKPKIKIVPKKSVVDDKVKKLRLNIHGSIIKATKNKESAIYGDETRIPVVEDTISTGCPNVDYLMAKAKNNTWGFPSGRLVYLVGKEKCGKTTLMMNTMKYVLDNGGVVYLIESERTFDPKLAKAMGIDVGQIIFSQPETLDDCMDMVTIACESIFKMFKKDNSIGRIPIYIPIDSISALPTKREVENDFQKKSIAEHSQIISRACRKFTPMSANLNSVLFWILQRRTKIGVMYGDDTTFIGGDAIKFHCSVGLKMVRKGYLKKSDGKKYGIISNLSCVHNKCRPPLASTDIEIIWGKGIDEKKALLTALKDKNLAKTSKGSRKTVFKYGKTKIEWVGYNDFKKITCRDLDIMRKALSEV